jgi:hypothetical protein
MFVLPVGCIVGPLLVINDILEAGRTSKDQFMAILPRHKQSKYFINYMYSPDPATRLTFHSLMLTRPLTKKKLLARVSMMMRYRKVTKMTTAKMKTN